MILVPIAFIVVVIDLVQSIGWVAPSYTCTDIVLDCSITKLQCSMFCVKRAITGYLFVQEHQLS